MIVSFLGTKGGTGTTTLAVNCAADIRRITNRSHDALAVRHRTRLRPACAGGRR
jgi:Flp pilus assembly CpaE family ATPase